MIPITAYAEVFIPQSLAPVKLRKFHTGTFHLIRRFLQLAGRMERSQAAGSNVLKDSSDWTLWRQWKIH
jgi:hypothetical protein